MRRVGRAAARFKNRGDILQQAEWSREACDVRAEIDALPGEGMAPNERRAAIEILLALNSVAANVYGRATRAEADQHLAAAKRHLKNKPEEEE